MDALKAAITAIDEATAGEPEAAVSRATAVGLMRGYHARWAGAAWHVVSRDDVEQEFREAIINPDTGKPSRTFDHAGKIDGVVSYRGRELLLEHKTTSEDITDPNAPYFRRLEIDAQVSGYMLAHWQAGRKLDGTLYDVVRKPGIRPKQVSRGGRIETPEEFCERLTADTLERPDFYYARTTIYRQDHQLLEFARELWEVADEIRQARVYDRHYRNSGSCMMFNRPCEYLGLCSGHDTPDGGRWRKKERVHAELPLVEDDGRNTLTNSRIACFKACRRKHYYKYEIGLERADRHTDEALYFGSVMHEAWAAWWRCQVPPEEESNEHGQFGPQAGTVCGSAGQNET